jgi:hypothetical protein
VASPLFSMAAKMSDRLHAFRRLLIQSVRPLLKFELLQLLAALDVPEYNPLYTSCSFLI